MLIIFYIERLQTSNPTAFIPYLSNTQTGSKYTL